MFPPPTGVNPRALQNVVTSGAGIIGPNSSSASRRFSLLVLDLGHEAVGLA